MTTAPLHDAEAWFGAQRASVLRRRGPQRVRAALRLRRAVPLLVVTVAVAAAVALGFVPVLSDDSDSLFLALGVVAVTLAAYALVALRLLPVLRWGAAYTFRSLGLMVPLVTRALPLLLLFLTFLFINTEVWQVARDEPAAAVDQRAGLRRAGHALPAGAPSRGGARGRAGRGGGAAGGELRRDPGGERRAGRGRADSDRVELGRMPRANLVLALLFAQAVQVLSLRCASTRSSSCSAR